MLKKQFITKPDFNNDAKDLISKLLVPNSSIRLGMLRNGTNDIWQHPFIIKSGYTVDKIMKREIKPPYCPHINTTTDVYNFEEFDNIDFPIKKYTGKFDYKEF